jgi:hypothetical protein
LELEAIENALLAAFSQISSTAQAGLVTMALEIAADAVPF